MAELTAVGDAARAARPAPGGRRAVLAYKARIARRYWFSALVTGVFTPVVYVAALGVGLGVVVNRHGHSLGVPYLQFVAPAFLVAAAVQIAANDSAYPVVAGFKWQRFYHGMAATPLTPTQICDGELGWLALRQIVNSALYLAIMAAFGGVRSGWVVLAIPIAALTGSGFGACVAAVAATTNHEGNLFNVLSRFVVTPMFLFSGTFYPITRLPEWARVIAWITPLWHGTQLARAAALAHPPPTSAIVVHVGYLLLWLGVGLTLARWRFRVRLGR